MSLTTKIRLKLISRYFIFSFTIYWWYKNYKNYCFILSRILFFVEMFSSKRKMCSKSIPHHWSLPGMYFEKLSFSIFSIIFFECKENLPIAVVKSRRNASYRDLIQYLTSIIFQMRWFTIPFKCNTIFCFVENTIEILLKYKYKNILLKVFKNEYKYQAYF